MMAALRSITSGVPLILTVLLLPSEGRYVQSGSDVTDCSMKCPDEKAVLSLYKDCGDNETNLAELWCDTMSSSNGSEPRFHLNTSSGCWTLTGAKKNDSCRYNLWLHNSSGGFLHSTDITVLDPVLITNITSNSSRLGEDIAVSVHFSGEETAVTWEVDGERFPVRYHLIDDNRTLIIQRAQEDDAGRRLRVQITNPVSNETQEYQLPITDLKYSRLRFPAALGIFPLLIILIVLSSMCYKKRKSCKKDVENDDGNDHPEERERLSSSSADADKAKTWQTNLIDLIRRLCRISRYEETPQREMEEGRKDTPPEVAQNGVDRGPYSAGILFRE